MKAFINGSWVIITLRGQVILTAKGTKHDIRRLMLIAQERLQDMAA